MMTDAKKIRVGGLFRCCIATVGESAPADPEEGTVLNCKWCSDSVRFRDGAWERNNPPIAKTEPTEGSEGDDR